MLISSFSQVKENEVHLASVRPWHVPAGDAELQVYWTSLLRYVILGSSILGNVDTE